MLVWLSWPCLGVAAIGSVYALGAAVAVRTFARRSLPATPRLPSVSVLKPLSGAEDGLYQALASFCMQDYPAPVQILFGASRADDACVLVVRKLIADFPSCDLELIIDGHEHGANGKVSNLINLSRHIRHELVVVSDSDIHVQHDYLRGVAGAFATPGTGVVTCLYRGTSRSGPWAKLSAMAIDYHFLPSVLVGLRLQLAHPCLGSTIALMRDTLQRIGGFAPFVDQLADDYVMGAAVRRIGMKIGIAPLVVAHLCTERSARELISHELRWARTIRAIDPCGFAGSIVTHPLPFALLFAMLSGFDLTGWLTLTIVLLCRLVVVSEVDRAFAGASDQRWLLPFRDLLSFFIFAASFFVAVVKWRGHRYRVRPDGTLLPLKATAP